MHEISSKSVRTSSFRLSTKNAWAKYVRNRWTANTLGAIQAEWDLTEGEARGVLYAQASQTTIDKIMDREEARRMCGAFRLGLAILEIRTQLRLRITSASRPGRPPMKPYDGPPKKGAWRSCQLASLAAIAWVGAMLSKVGPVGQRIRAWALERAAKL